MLASELVVDALSLIEPHIVRTPVLYSEELSELLGCGVYLKLDSHQVSGSFKVRGLLNYILTQKNKGNLPRKLVAYSSGNHALALAWASKYFGCFEAEVYMSEFSSKKKQKTIADLGANLVLTKNRPEAEQRSHEEGSKDGCAFVHPSDNDLLIPGAGTACLEALQDMDESPDAIFASCGGGALLSGSYLASLLFPFAPKVIAAEPIIANDAAISVRQGSIYRFEDSPPTIADGARTIAVSKRTFEYLQKIESFEEVSEADIIHYYNLLNKKLSIKAEATAALALGGAAQWAIRNKPKNILVMISGGNES